MKIYNSKILLNKIKIKMFLNFFNIFDIII